MCISKTCSWTTYLVGLVSGGLHLLIDPALEFVGVPEELLQMERVLEGGPAKLGALMKGVASAQQLKYKNKGFMYCDSAFCQQSLRRRNCLLGCIEGHFRVLISTYRISAGGHILFGVMVVLDQFGSKFIQGL